MYIPKYYQMENYTEIKKFMIAHPFITLVTMSGDKPIATHVPVTVEEREEELVLLGHLAKRNPQCHSIDQNAHVLAIFHGPHDYISSSWYEEEDVPTWDYQSVHAYGHGRIMSDTELQEALKVMLTDYEAHRENGATWDNLSGDTKKQIAGIHGFEVKVTTIEAAYKLSQTRSEVDKDHIVSELKNTGKQMSKQLAEQIEQQYRS